MRTPAAHADSGFATESSTPFPCAHLIKEIGRGAQGARALSEGDTYALYRAMLVGRVNELELGAIILAYRLKGETAAELAAMLAAAHDTMERLAAPARAPRAVSIPSTTAHANKPT